MRRKSSAIYGSGLLFCLVATCSFIWVIQINQHGGEVVSDETYNVAASGFSDFPWLGLTVLLGFAVLLGALARVTGKKLFNPPQASSSRLGS